MKHLGKVKRAVLGNLYPLALVLGVAGLLYAATHMGDWKVKLHVGQAAALGNTHDQRLSGGPRAPRLHPYDVHGADYILKDILQLGDVQSSNHYRWSILKREIQEDRKNKDVDFPFVIMDYGSSFGYFSLALASTFPSAMVFSVEGEAISMGYTDSHVPKEGSLLGGTMYHRLLAKRLGISNNVICKSTFTLATFASLRMTSMVFDYQIALGVFQYLPIKSRKEFNAVLATFVSLAKVTILDIPARETQSAAYGDKVRKWYEDRLTPYDLIKEALRDANVAITLVASASDGIYRIVNNNANSFGIGAGRAFCEHLFEILECENSLETNDCPEQDIEVIQKRALALTTKATTPRPSQVTQQQQSQAQSQAARNAVHQKAQQPGVSGKQRTPVLKKIPDDICGKQKGLVVEKIRDCGGDTPQSSWEYENDGWYKCRNATHWLTGCRRVTTIL